MTKKKPINTHPINSLDHVQWKFRGGFGTNPPPPNFLLFIFPLWLTKKSPSPPPRGYFHMCLKKAAFFSPFLPSLSLPPQGRNRRGGGIPGSPLPPL